MANYVVTPDDYAGWNPTGRYFAYASGAVGLIGLVCWLALHGRLGLAPPTQAADQTILTLLSWIGAGAFFLLTFVAVGSISISLKTRGTVTVTETGVTRVVGKRSSSLNWSEIAGFVAMPGGGVTLIPTVDKPTIFVPRFLDNYRACIAELRDHGLQPLPPNRLRATRRKVTWQMTLAVFSGTFFYVSAMDPHHTHRLRISFFCAALAILTAIVYRDATRPDERTSAWISGIGLTALMLWAVWRMAHSW